MYNCLVSILILSNLLLVAKCLIIHKHRTKDGEEICAKNYFRSISMSNLRVCYINNYQDCSVLVWFTIEKSLLNIFHVYRFILRSIDEASLSTVNVHILTNFTQLVDLNNSINILNLEPGQYEICIDFQSFSSSYIYSPRNGCIFIRRGDLLHGSLKQTSTQLFIALVTTIIIFLIAAVIVQSMQVQRTQKRKRASNDSSENSNERNSKESSVSLNILSMISLKKQRYQVVRKLFPHQIDQAHTSRIQQWLFSRTTHHCDTVENQEIKRSKQTFTEENHSSSTPNIVNNGIYTIPMKKCSQKVSFYLTPSED